MILLHVLTGAPKIKYYVIFENNYPDLTLISVTQKIAPVRHFEQIILLMEGEIIATGKHKALLESSPEYVQIYSSQRSTQHYEL